MRTLCASFLFFVALAAASAADLKVKVIDPQSAAVAGAQVSLSTKGKDARLKIVTTSAEGIAAFVDLSSGTYQIQVLAPGFALLTTDLDVPSQSHAVTNQFTIQLRLASASETVVVTATRSPALAEETGASISTLENAQLETMKPVDAADAVRFLPGAV